MNTNNLKAYARKSEAELRYIIQDARQAALAMREHRPISEAKYLDQINDACSILFQRRRRKSISALRNRYPTEFSAAQPSDLAESFTVTLNPFATLARQSTMASPRQVRPSLPCWAANRPARSIRCRSLAIALLSPGFS